MENRRPAGDKIFRVRGVPSMTREALVRHSSSAGKRFGRYRVVPHAGGRGIGIAMRDGVLRNPIILAHGNGSRHLRIRSHERPCRKKVIHRAARDGPRPSPLTLFFVIPRAFDDMYWQHHSGTKHRYTMGGFVNNLCTIGEYPESDIREAFLRAPLRPERDCRAPFRQTLQRPVPYSPATLQISGAPEKRCG
jgi:hypothetical protein